MGMRDDNQIKDVSTGLGEYGKPGRPKFFLWVD